MQDRVVEDALQHIRRIRLALQKEHAVGEVHETAGGA